MNIKVITENKVVPQCGRFSEAVGICRSGVRGEERRQTNVSYQPSAISSVVSLRRVGMYSGSACRHKYTAALFIQLNHL